MFSMDEANAQLFIAGAPTPPPSPTAKMMPSTSCISATISEQPRRFKTSEKIPANPPSSFLCPITLVLMTDPVFTIDGHTYDRSSISRWFQLGPRTSPKTGIHLASIRLSSNYSLRSAIEEWLIDHNPLTQDNNSIGTDNGGDGDSNSNSNTLDTLKRAATTLSTPPATPPTTRQRRNSVAAAHTDPSFTCSQNPAVTTVQKLLRLSSAALWVVQACDDEVNGYYRDCSKRHFADTDTDADTDAAGTAAHNAADRYRKIAANGRDFKPRVELVRMTGGWSFRKFAGDGALYTYYHDRARPLPAPESGWSVDETRCADTFAGAAQTPIIRRIEAEGEGDGAAGGAGGVRYWSEH